jgi:hypothetical protein
MHERKRRVRFFAKNGKRKPFCELSFLVGDLFSYYVQSLSFLYKRGETFLPNRQEGTGRDSTGPRTGRYVTIRDEIGEG